MFYYIKCEHIFFFAREFNQHIFEKKKVVYKSKRILRIKTTVFT